MSQYHVVTLDPLTLVGSPTPLPREFVGLAPASLADLSWTGTDSGGAYVGKGYWPVVDVRPAPAVWQRNAVAATYVAAADLKHVTATYALEDRPLADVKADRLAALAALRWQIETGGITIGGVSVRTDIESQGKITGAHALVTAAPSTVIDWKGASGWVQLDAATMTAIALAVGTHIQACYSAEKTHAEAISAAETAEAAGTYDFTGGWPE